MAITEEILGKKIHELETLNMSLDDDAWFVIAQNNLTRKINLNTLRQSFSSDPTEKGSDVRYYSTEKIDEMIKTIYEKIKESGNNMTEINNTIKTLNDRIEEVRSDLLRYIDEWILKGYDVPTAETCPPGRVYLQLFK